jgi:hypothetical protein
MPRNAVAYDEDFFEWTEEQARLLRAGELSDIDAINLAEEIESAGKSDRREVHSRLTVLLTHLLKWKFQPCARSNSWRSTIREQRARIELVLEDSPSFRPFVAEALARAFKTAREVASEETGLPEAGFPAECPFMPEQILAAKFLPED